MLDENKVAENLMFPILVVLISGFVFWLFSLESRVAANTNEAVLIKTDIQVIKADTAFILCKMGEGSRCEK